VSTLLSLGQAASMLGVSVDTVRRYLDNGTLDGCVLPSGHRRIYADSVNAVLAGTAS